MARSNQNNFKKSVRNCHFICLINKDSSINHYIKVKSLSIVDLI